ncbi:uncharacterized protein LOC106167804 [Lingula anatina]|uniref:Uncharacterized protein LOC106167804 n=1 Tax=Lingula anatina TaxID=7574 RepID=A0A1S3IVA6_LINAN|nr:uncharacterized protein LOC106167804 [Lingula anatina]|eukprot:XP_013402132.1 uncharacterized protein LOC106167804 [Lingula anatina]
MDFHAAMETLAEAWVAANTQTALTAEHQGPRPSVNNLPTMLPREQFQWGQQPSPERAVAQPSTSSGVKSLPIHCVVEHIQSPVPPDGAAAQDAPDTTIEQDGYAILASNTPFHDIVVTALLKLGYNSLDAMSAKGAIQIKNWKPLAFDTITENKEATIDQILGELTNIATLRIKISSSSSSTSSPDIKDKLLRLLLSYSQELLLSSGCPLDKDILSQISQGQIITDSVISPTMKEDFYRWYQDQLQSRAFSVLASLNQDDKESQRKTMMFLQQQVPSAGGATEQPLGVSTVQTRGTYLPPHPSMTQAQIGEPNQQVSFPPNNSHHHLLLHRSPPAGSTADDAQDVTSPSSVVGSAGKSRPRMRVNFDPHYEVPRLLYWFNINDHPNRTQMEAYVAKLNSLPTRYGKRPLDVTNIMYWFKNLRAARRRIARTEDSLNALSDSNDKLNYNSKEHLRCLPPQMGSTERFSPSHPSAVHPLSVTSRPVHLGRTSPQQVTQPMGLSHSIASIVNSPKDEKLGSQPSEVKSNSPRLENSHVSNSSHEEDDDEEIDVEDDSEDESPLRIVIDPNEDMLDDESVKTDSTCLESSNNKGAPSVEEKTVTAHDQHTSNNHCQGKISDAVEKNYNSQPIEVEVASSAEPQEEPVDFSLTKRSSGDRIPRAASVYSSSNSRPSSVASSVGSGSLSYEPQPEPAHKKIKMEDGTSWSAHGGLPRHQFPRSFSRSSSRSPTGSSSRSASPLENVKGVTSSTSPSVTGVFGLNGQIKQETVKDCNAGLYPPSSAQSPLAPGYQGVPPPLFPNGKLPRGMFGGAQIPSPLTLSSLQQHQQQQAVLPPIGFNPYFNPYFMQAQQSGGMGNGLLMIQPKSGSSSPTTSPFATSPGSGHGPSYARSDPDHEITTSPTVTIEKRQRTRVFIDPITEIPRLESWFLLDTHPSMYEMEKYCDILNSSEYRQKFPKLNVRNVQLWFKNHRAKVKRLKGADVRIAMAYEMAEAKMMC